jgi:hypothetical protein
LDDLVRTLNRGVRAIAALDDGGTLIKLHAALEELREWWPRAVS